MQPTIRTTVNTKGNTMTAAVRTIAATIFITVISIAAFKMRSTGVLDPWSFGIALVFGLAGFAFISSIGEVLLLKLWQFEIKFREIQRSEEEVKALACATVDLVMSLQNVVYSVPDDGKVYGKIRDSALRILDQAGVSQDDSLRKQVESMNKNEVHTA